MTHRRIIGWLVPLILACGCLGVWGADWPQWRGPDHSGVTSELSGWDGRHWNLQERWKADAGHGMAASPIIAGARVFVMGRDGDADQVLCLELKSGNLLWRQRYRCRSDGRFRKGESPEGPTCTPSFDADTGFVYTLGNDGDLYCWNAGQDGKPVWNFNLYEQYGIDARRSGAKQDPARDYGYVSNVLLWKDLALVEVGDEKQGNIMAFDKRTGQRQWASEDKHDSGHNSGPVMMSVKGEPCVVSFTLEGLRIMRADGPARGRNAAWYPWSMPFNVNLPTPCTWADHVLLTSTSDYESGAKTTLLEITPDGASRKWAGKPQAYVSSPVFHKGAIYIIDEQGRLSCMSPDDGKLIWQGAKFGGVTGSLIVTGDDKIIAWGDTHLLLVDATPGATGVYKERARINAPLPKQKGRGSYQAHPALGNGCLIVKSKDGRMLCYDALAGGPR